MNNEHERLAGGWGGGRRLAWEGNGAVGVAEVGAVGVLWGCCGGAVGGAVGGVVGVMWGVLWEVLWGCCGGAVRVLWEVL